MQLTSGEVSLLQNASKYVSIFSDSNYDEWPNDKASADSVAWRVLEEYHPLEPEVVLQLAGAAFRQWQCGTSHGGKRDIVAPKGDATPEVVAYMQRKWRQDKMSFLEFLRKSTAKVMQSWRVVQNVRLSRPACAWSRAAEPPNVSRQNPQPRGRD